MSPAGQTRGNKITIPENLYTVIVAAACGAVLATAIFVAYQCYSQYGTLFGIP
jgi:hypothetical protein